jgi:hypothetical protein
VVNRFVNKTDVFLTDMAKIRVMDVRFSDDELAKIAAWEPITPGFGRDRAIVSRNIGPILDRLRGRTRVWLSELAEGETSNYFSFIVYDASIRPEAGCEVSNARCIMVQLSLMAPVGVIGESTFSAGEKFFAWDNLNPAAVRDPASAGDWITSLVIDAVREESPYRLIGRDVTDQPLPAGVKVYEYCLCDEPWDLVFHALFADSD